MKKCMAVILAAGEGTRMRSKRPKVLHEAAGRSMLEWVMRAAHGVEMEKCIVVCGRGSEQVQERLGEKAVYVQPVSYTHLDVYKRQPLHPVPADYMFLVFLHA